MTLNEQVTDFKLEGATIKALMETDATPQRTQYRKTHNGMRFEVWQGNDAEGKLGYQPWWWRPLNEPYQSKINWHILGPFRTSEEATESARFSRERLSRDMRDIVSRPLSIGTRNAAPIQETSAGLLAKQPDSPRNERRIPVKHDSRISTEAMFSHAASGGDWEYKTLQECLDMVASGTAYECFEHDNYDDGARNFHCAAPCAVCDVSNIGQGE